MMKGNLLALLIYVMCGLEWSDDIEICANIRHLKQEAQGTTFFIEERREGLNLALIHLHELIEYSSI